VWDRSHEPDQPTAFNGEQQHSPDQKRFFPFLFLLSCSFNNFTWHRCVHESTSVIAAICSSKKAKRITKPVQPKSGEVPSFQRSRQQAVEGVLYIKGTSVMIKET
jgi:hypothetical protein